MTGTICEVAISRKKTFLEDWKKKYKYCGFSLSLWKIDFFSPWTLGGNLWELSWNDCAPACVVKQKEKPLLLSNVPYVNGGLQEHTSWHAERILQILREHWSADTQNLHHAGQSALCNLGNLSSSMNENGCWRNRQMLWPKAETHGHW